MKIVLSRIKPQVWRRLEVLGDVKLSRLRSIFIEGMGWMDCHLHRFVIDGISYGIPDPDFPEGMEDGKRFTLAQVAPPVKGKFRFDYDFGDDWEHVVTVEEIMEPEAGVVYPRCTGGANACPPEDCGGAWGYEELLATIRDPKHEEHERMMEWVGGDFDPTEFSLDAVNTSLRGVRGDVSFYEEIASGEVSRRAQRRRRPL